MTEFKKGDKVKVLSIGDCNSPCSGGCPYIGKIGYIAELRPDRKIWVMFTQSEDTDQGGCSAFRKENLRLPTIDNWREELQC